MASCLAFHGVSPSQFIELSPPLQACLCEGGLGPTPILNLQYPPHHIVGHHLSNQASPKMMVSVIFSTTMNQITSQC